MGSRVAAGIANAVEARAASKTIEFDFVIGISCVEL
jgi:hypothetical protein